MTDKNGYWYKKKYYCKGSISLAIESSPPHVQFFEFWFYFHHCYIKNEYFLTFKSLLIFYSTIDIHVIKRI